MKNDFRNDGRQNMAWLADQGASEAEYDGQGGVVHKEKQPPESEYERLTAYLYKVANTGYPGCSTLERLFADFPDLAHAIGEGVKDRKKQTVGKWPYGLARLEKPKLSTEQIESDIMWYRIIPDTQDKDDNK